MSISHSHIQFQAALDKFSGTLKALLTRHCHARSGLDIDDVAQEVRIRLWRAVESGRILDLNASYIQKLVISVIIDAARHRKAHLTSSLEDYIETIQEIDLKDKFQPEQETDQHMLMLAVTQCIITLPQRRRVPVQLHLQGFTLVEIATFLNTTAEAVRKLVSRGTNELKEKLQAMGIDYVDI